MGILDFFRKKLSYDDDEYDDAVDEQLEPDGEYDAFDDYEHMEEASKGENIDIDKFDAHDIKGYIRNQCDVMESASREIELAQSEYDAVKSYFSDIQLIETASEEIHEEIIRNAELVAELTVDRRIFKTGENRLSQHAFFKMEKLEPFMPDALIEFQNNEAYYETVHKDMKMLEGERMALRYDARDLTKRQNTIRKMAQISAVGLCFVFAVFLLVCIAIGEAGGVLFSVVIALAACIAIGLFWMMKSTQRELELTQRKINRATVLLNKVKIKYINIASTVDYERDKYGVKSSYELSNQYDMYLQIRKEQERIARMTEQLSEAEIRLESLLKQLKLYDPHIWLAQVKALLDPKEMVEVRHGLSTRRQKLRAKIKYNENRIDEAKKNITRAAVNNPECKQEVLDIIEQYENSL